MKKWLHQELICPECIESQVSLELEIFEEKEGDVLEGRLLCPSCQSRYPINEGIAVVVPEKTRPVVEEHTGYNSESMLSAYLWSHFSEFFNGPDATDAYRIWASHFTPTDGWALDIGCSVGRLSLELSKSHTRAIGVDTSLGFIRAARRLTAEKKVAFDLIVEGRITAPKSSELDSEYGFDRVEFIVADAMALPFKSGLFATAASINILEKVPDPGQHFRETNRILQPRPANFLFSDPFSWDEGVSHPDLWLGGRNSGPFKGRGMDQVTRLMNEDPRFFDLLFDVKAKGEVLWKIRKTRNLWEYITSQFIIGTRS